MVNQLGGCSGTRYGCCPDLQTAKANRRGTNCSEYRERSRVQHIGYHPRHRHNQYYHNIYPVRFINTETPIIHRKIIHEKVNTPENNYFHIYNIIIALIIVLFLVLMIIRFK